jgi:hypothetical protein
MFRQSWAPPRLYHRFAKDVKHRGATWTPWAHMGKSIRWPSTIRYHAREPREVVYYSSLDDRPWDAHGIVIACDMVRHNTFVKGLRRLGWDKCANIKHLRILWSGDEMNVIGTYVEGADSMSILLTSLLIQTCLPNIWHITLQKRRPKPDEERLSEWDTSDVESPECHWPTRPSVYLGKEAKASFLSRGKETGGSELYETDRFSLRNERSFIRAVDFLVDACSNVSINSTILRVSHG